MPGTVHRLQWPVTAAVLLGASAALVPVGMRPGGPWSWHAGVVLALLGAALLIAGRTRLADAVGFTALLVAGGVARLTLTGVEPFAVYQHLLMPGDWSPAGAASIAVLALQLVAVVVALLRDPQVLKDAGAVFREHPASSLLVGGLVVFASAVPTRDLGATALEVASSSVLLASAWLTAFFAVRALPEDSLAAVGAAMRARLSLPGDDGAVRAWDRRWPNVIALVTVVGTAGFGWYVFDGLPHIDDSISYLFHAKVFAAGQLTLPAPPDSSAFHVDEVLVNNGRWFGYGFPGWPAVLSLGVLAGAPWLVNPLLAGMTVRLAHACVALVEGRGTANIAAVLLAASPWLWFMSGEFMAHPLAALLAVAAMYAAERASRARALGWGGACGLALGALALVRPMDAGLLALLVAWRLWTVGGAWRSLPALGTAAGVAMLVAAAVLPYNRALTGVATYTPQMMWTDRRWGVGSDRLGFGADVGIPAWTNIDPLPGHGPVDVLMNLNKNLFVTQSDLFGWSMGSLALVLAAMVLGGLRQSRGVWIAWIGLFMLGYSAHWFSGGPDLGARYWYPVILPLVVLSIVGGRRLAGAWATPGASARVASLAAIAVMGAWIAFVPSQAIRKYDGYRGIDDRIRWLVDSTGAGSVLVFVEVPDREVYQAAFNLNPLPLDKGGAVFAHAAGDQSRARVMAAFPGREVWVLTRRTPGGELVLRPAQTMPETSRAAGAVHGGSP